MSYSFLKTVPDQLQPQLNLPRGSGPDHTCIDDRLPARIKYGIICVIQKIGSRKVGMIQNIEELSSELYIERFREFWDMRVLENREVYRLEAWSIQAVSACMADEVNARASNSWTSCRVSGIRSQRAERTVLWSLAIQRSCQLG